MVVVGIALLAFREQLGLDQETVKWITAMICTLVWGASQKPIGSLWEKRNE
jgi:hypothetical protein